MHIVRCEISGCLLFLPWDLIERANWSTTSYSITPAFWHILTLTSTVQIQINQIPHPFRSQLQGWGSIADPFTFIGSVRVPWICWVGEFLETDSIIPWNSSLWTTTNLCWIILLYSFQASSANQSLLQDEIHGPGDGLIWEHLFHFSNQRTHANPRLALPWRPLLGWVWGVDHRCTSTMRLGPNNINLPMLSIHVAVVIVCYSSDKVNLMIYLQ